MWSTESIFLSYLSGFSLRAERNKRNFKLVCLMSMYFILFDIGDWFWSSIESFLVCLAVCLWIHGFKCLFSCLYMETTFFYITDKCCQWSESNCFVSVLGSCEKCSSRSPWICQWACWTFFLCEPSWSLSVASGMW